MERSEASAIFLSYFLIMLVLGIVMSIIRKYILKNKKNPTGFEGLANFGTLVVALVTEHTWVATLLHSSGFGLRFGISGPLWYSTTAIFPNLLFAILFTQFRRRAPGARTFLQVSHARFGKTAHMVLCAFALLNNFSILPLVISSGSRVFSGITARISFELVWVITVIVSGICASAGSIRQSLPTRVVIGCFLMICTLATVVRAFFVDHGSGLGSLDRIYELISDERSMDANDAKNVLTFRKFAPVVTGIRRFVSLCAQIFMDQTIWELCSHSIPGQESTTIITAVIIWTALPLAFGTCCSLSYISLKHSTFKNISLEDAVTMAPSMVYEDLFGQNGVLLLFAMNAYILVTVGIFQIYAISSILTVDIFSTHIQPFRVCYDTNCCLLCSKTRDLIARPKDKCECRPVSACEQCQHDLGYRRSATGSVRLVSNCRVHTDFRNYEKHLEKVNRSAILLILGGMLPVGLFLNYPGVSATSINEAINTAVTGALGSVVYSLFWGKLTGPAVVGGSTLSALLAICVWLILWYLSGGPLLPAITYDEVFMISALTGFLAGFILPVLIVFCSKRNNASEVQRSWQMLCEMDNPLRPWSAIYANIFYLPTYDAAAYSPPDPTEVGKVFRCSWLSAIIASCVFPVVTFVLWPGLSCIHPNFSLTAFKVWIGLIVFYLVCCTIGCILLPLLGFFKVFDNCYRQERTEELISMTSDLPTIEYFVSSDGQEQSVEVNEGREVRQDAESVEISEDDTMTSERKRYEIRREVEANKQPMSAALLEVNPLPQSRAPFVETKTK